MFSEYACVFCGQPVELPVVHRYCSTRCAARQLAALGALLNSSPRHAFSALEWRDLGSNYATELELLELVSRGAYARP